jgi:hypothetical protein
MWEYLPTMRFEKKDFALLIPATLLAVGGLGPDDPWVIGPCLFLSWITFIIICIIHEGSRFRRIFAGVVITAILFGVGYRRFHLILAKELPKEAAKSETVSMTLPSSPVFDFQISKALLRASVKIDTKYMLRYRDNFYIMIILRVLDNSVEALDDARLSKSATFEITGDVRAIEMPLTEVFFDRAERAGRLGNGNIGLNLVLIPKNISPDQIVTMRDVTRLGGMQTTIDHGLQEKADPY